MKDECEKSMALRHMYSWLEDVHGFNMDAPLKVPAGSMNGWCWPIQNYGFRTDGSVEG